MPEAIDAARSAFGKEERQRSSIVHDGRDPPRALRRGGPDRRARTDVDPAALLAGSDTLYLCAPAHDQRRLTPLFVRGPRAVVDGAYDRVARTGRPLDPPLLVVLDEAANIAPVPDLDALAATAAGHGIQLVTVWHDLAQITARFGPRATTVVNNHRAKLFLSGISDPATLDYASHLVGDEERRRPPATTSGGRSGRSTTRSPTLRRLAPPDALRRTAAGRGRPRLPAPRPGPAHAADLVRRPMAGGPGGRGGRWWGTGVPGRRGSAPGRVRRRVDPPVTQFTQSEVIPTTAEPSWSLIL